MVSSRTGLRAALRRHALAALAAAGVLVLGLIAVFSIELQSSQQKSRNDVIARVHERSVLAAALIDSLLRSVAQQVPFFEARYGSRHVSAQVLNTARQQNAYVALVDRSGRVLAASNGFTAQARADLAYSAALRLVRAGRAYALGNVLPYGRTGVVNLAVAFATRYGERFLLTGFSLPAFSPFLNGELHRIPGVKGSRNYVLDGNDVVLASTNPARPAGYRFAKPGQIAALRLTSGSRRGYYFDEVGVANSTWRIILAAPESRLFASVTGVRKWLPWLIFAAFALVAAAALLLGVRVVRSAEGDLRDANAQLQTVNEQLEQANETLAHDALHDPLTGLPNRALFMDRLDQIVQRASRDGGIGCAVLFIDLDGFKLVNDSLSHAVGDQLLMAVARRFHHTLRPGDTVARIGGDEFAVLLDGVSTESGAIRVADRVHGCLAEPFDVSPHRLFVRASIGISLRADDVSVGVAEQVGRIAMYDAKRRRTSTYSIFDETMRQRVVDRLERENELRTAVKESLIRVHYQPIVDLHTGEVRGLEALARWPRGWPEVSPVEFIPVAEDSGVVRALGRQVLRAALEAFSDWRKRGLVPEEACISVNISRRQLDDPGLPQEILASLAAAGVPANRLRLEITESTLVHEPHRMQRIVSEVCAHGVGLHLDDFGTQYSSLAALLQFPVVALKIDRSFITSVINESTGSETIVQTMVTLAHGLGLTAIAEGIEHGEELQRLTAMGCDWGQGFLFAEPLGPGATENLLASVGTIPTALRVV